MADTTADQLLRIMPHARERVDTFIAPLNAAMARYSIITPARQAAFLAQCAHESVELQYMRELGNGAQYEGRTDLGNVHPGDGAKYKGGGIIQITGFYNYLKYSSIGVDLVNHPELIEEPANACMVSACFWQSTGLNLLADGDAFGSITHKVNGGYNGLDSRIKYWLRARAALAVT